MIDFFIFIKHIPPNQDVLIFPFITASKKKKPEDSYLRLSNQFLVNRDSNAKLISDFLDNQWIYSDFSSDKILCLYFKYKSITIEPKNP